MNSVSLFPEGESANLVHQTCMQQSISMISKMIDVCSFGHRHSILRNSVYDLGKENEMMSKASSIEYKNTEAIN